MKTLKIIGLMLLAVSLVMSYGSVGAAESTVNLDRCAVLNNPGDAGAALRIAMHFALPAEVEGKEVVYSTLSFTIPALELKSEVLIEIAVFPILREWSENDIEYETAIDSLSIGSFTIKLGENNQFDIDITPYIRQILEDGRNNFGLMGTAELLSDFNVQLPNNADVHVMNSAEVILVYK